MKKRYLISFIISLILLIIVYFKANNIFPLFQIITLITMSTFIYPFVYKLIPSKTKQNQFVSSIISVIVCTIFIYNLWPLLYECKFNSYPNDYTFYVPFLNNITSFAQNFYTIRVSITQGIPELTPIGIRNTIYNILNVIVSIALILIIPFLYDSKTISKNRNYMQEYQSNKK